MDNSERHARILSVVNERSNVSVAELGNELGVSEATIRRDLGQLDEAGALRRTHGGARKVALSRVEAPFFARTSTASDAKGRVAQAAVALLADDESVILDSGTTCLEVAKRLSGKELTVMPLSLRSLNTVAGFAHISLALCAGSVRPQEQSIVGPLATETISRFRFDTAIIAGCGFGLDDGLTVFDVEDAAVKQAAIRSASRAVLLCDATKWNQRTFAWAAATSAFTTIITDHRLTDAERQQAADLKVEVITV